MTETIFEDAARMNVLAASLPGFLKRAAAIPATPGQADCAFWVAAWIVEVLGRDPVPLWRDAYSTEAGREKVLKRNGGMLAIAERVARTNGFARVDVPSAGDVVCVDFNGLQVMGIAVDDKRVALKTPNGVQVDVPPVLAAWRIVA